MIACSSPKVGNPSSVVSVTCSSNDVSLTITLVFGQSCAHACDPTVFSVQPTTMARHTPTRMNSTRAPARRNGMGSIRLAKGATTV